MTTPASAADLGAISDDLDLALALGKLAAEIALPLFHEGVSAEKKPDGSIVTRADFEVERELLEVLTRERPSDAVLSEERGAVGASARRWIVDPIDGTWLFAHQFETWGTHVALEIDGEVVLGVITRPVHGECWWALRGQGAYRARLGSRMPLERLRVSAHSDAAQAHVMLWARGEIPLGALLRERKQWVEPSLDGILQLAAGRLDALVDFQGAPWDLAPAVPIVEEAGGRFFDREGGRRLDRAGGCFTNGRLDAAVRDLLSTGVE